MLRSKYRIYLYSIAIVAVFFMTSCGNKLELRNYQIETNKIENPIRLAVITDLHGTFYGKEQSDLIAKIEEQNPDAILFVGDIIDKAKDYKATEQLLDGIAKKYPCYYAIGNHELSTGDIEGIEEVFTSYGVNILKGEWQEIQLKGQKIKIAGLDDIKVGEEEWNRQLEQCKQAVDDKTFTVLLSHRPHLVNEYEASGFDLVLSGHAHGGQWRVPGLFNGIYAPDQGFLPKYAGGRYQLGKTTLIVSRGLAIGRIPRFFNPPELVLVDIKPE